MSFVEQYILEQGAFQEFLKEFKDEALLSKVYIPSSKICRAGEITYKLKSRKMANSDEIKAVLMNWLITADKEELGLVGKNLDDLCKVLDNDDEDPIPNDSDTLKKGMSNEKKQRMKAGREKYYAERRAAKEEELAVKSETKDSKAAENKNVKDPVSKEPIDDKKVSKEPVADKKEPIVHNKSTKNPVSDKKEPVSDKKVSKEPVADKKEPVVHKKSTKDPVSDKKETVSEKKVSKEPVADKKEPVSDKKVSKEPVVHKKSTKDPVNEKKPAKEPVVNKKSTKDPVNEKKPAKEPAADKTSTKDPVNEKKLAKEPTSDNKTAIDKKTSKVQTVDEKNVDKGQKVLTNTEIKDTKPGHKGGKPTSKSVDEDPKSSKKADEEQEQKRNKKDAIPKILKDLCWYTWIGKTVASHTCICCDRMEIRMNSFECGHVLAEAKGGQLSVENLRPICGGCNRSMGSENLEDFKRRCGFGELTKSEGVIKSDDKLQKPDNQVGKKNIVEDAPDREQAEEKSDSNKTELPIAQPLHDRRKTIKQGIKRQIWDKHVGADLAKAKCPCCKHNPIDVNTFSCAHFKGESEGGILEVDNLRPICSTCDTDIETQSISEFMKTYNIK